MFHDLKKDSGKVSIRLGFFDKDFDDEDQVSALERPMFEVGEFMRRNMSPHRAEEARLVFYAFMCPNMGGLRVQQIHITAKSDGYRERYVRDDPADAGVILAVEMLLQTYDTDPLLLTVTSVQEFWKSNLEAQLRLLKALRKTEAVLKDRSKAMEDISAKLVICRDLAVIKVSDVGPTEDLTE